MRIAQKIITSFFIIFIAPCSLANTFGSGNRDFAIFFDYSSIEDLSYCPRSGAMRCVLGAIKPNETLYLLSSKNSDVCLAKTEKSFQSEWDSGSFPLTKINLSSCPNQSFEVAFKNKAVPTYKKLAGLPSPSALMADKIDTGIRKKSSSFEPSSPVHQFQLSSEKPRIIRLPNTNKDVYIAIYENSITPGDQVHFFYTTNKIKLIHSASNIKTIFSLNNETYIHYSYTCRIGCGFGGDIIIKFSNSDFKTVLFDASTSS